MSKQRQTYTTEQIMEQAQVFASALSLVGGPFDSGNQLEAAEQEKAELAEMVSAHAVSAAQEPIKLSDDVREFLQEWIDSATGGEEDDVNYDFANQLCVLLGPIYTAQPSAEQLDTVKVPRGQLERMANDIAYAVFNLADKTLAGLRAGLVETSDPADTALIVERNLRALLAKEGE